MNSQADPGNTFAKAESGKLYEHPLMNQERLKTEKGRFTTSY